MSTEDQIKNLIKDYFKTRQIVAFTKRKYKIPLSVPSFDWEEVVEAVDSLLSTYLTMGEKVRRFEELFAKYIGSKEAVMVNSGSSANLIALNILSNPVLGDNTIKPGDEIIVPAVTWSTSIFPIINIGAIPVLVDINLETFSVKEEEIEEGVTDRTRAIVPVHLLGFPCNMRKIINIANKYKLYVIEDACEAHGAEWNGKKVGTFGDMGTFSFFFSHHITTIEGGMIVTDNEEYAELARVLRAHGWVRDLKQKDQILRKYPEIDPRFLFINMGFNVRPTEIQGAFGIHQIAKLEQFIKIRRENAKYWNEQLNKYSDYFIIHAEKENSRAVWFGYPITIKPNAPFKRKELVDYLESRGIETRPLVAGNMDEQPAMKLFRYRKVGNLSNSRLIMRNSFFIGNHHAIGEEEREYFVNIVKNFMKERVGVA
jgi:CDP-6-deoxy-D-xylo-4-hexulose-3-dehydrase